MKSMLKIKLFNFALELSFCDAWRQDEVHNVYVLLHLLLLVALGARPAQLAAAHQVAPVARELDDFLVGRP